MFIKSLHLKNILSFKDTKLDLQPLNVLIGPNGSGKSNLIDVIGLLRAVPDDIAGFLRRNGPTEDWIWKGQQESPTSDSLEIGAILESNFSGFPGSYDLEIKLEAGRLYSLNESLDLIDPQKGARIRPIFRASHGDSQLWQMRPHYGLDLEVREPVDVIVHRHKSILSEIRDPIEHGTINHTSRNLSRIKVYRNWHVGRDSPVRHPQRTDGDPNLLAEDFSNLALVVNDLLSRRLEPSLNDYLSRFYESYESLYPRIFGNTIELIVNEAGMGSSLPASRLSDGTIRFIALLAILCHPEPPPLICIEEPEIAMHPDSLDLVVELLRKASERTQIIVTTHSPWLIGRFSAEPEAVVVCDMDPTEGTRLHRLSHKEVEDWFDGARDLGDIWMSGAIQGVRW